MFLLFDLVSKLLDFLIVPQTSMSYDVVFDTFFEKNMAEAMAEANCKCIDCVTLVSA